MNRLELARTELLAQGALVLAATLGMGLLGEIGAEQNAAKLEGLTQNFDSAAERLVALLHGPKEEAEK